jgi:SAM-dependent methyltransferase
MPPNFDLIARPYRLLERLTLGRALERTRLHFLPQVIEARNALVLGDGDGRFLAALLAQNPHLQATAVDTSAAMLALLEARCAPYRDRLTILHADALTFTPTGAYDLICTHFFLDCLTQSDLDALVRRLALHLTGPWLVSDFRIPPGALRWPATILIQSLYFAFRILTGLSTTRLPDHELAFTRAGLLRTAWHLSLGGLLTTEIWSSAIVQN